MLILCLTLFASSHAFDRDRKLVERYSEHVPGEHLEREKFGRWTGLNIKH